MSGSAYPALAVNPPDVLGPMLRYAQVGQTQAQTRGLDLQNQASSLMLGYRQNLLAPLMGQQAAGMGAAGGSAAPGGPGGGGMPSYVMSPIGIPLPPMLYASAALSQNPDQAFKTAADMRRQRLFELAQQSTGDTWGQNVRTAYQEGWLTPQQAAQIASRPDMRAQVLQSLATPEANLGFQGRAIGQGVEPGPSGDLQPSPAVIAAKGATAAATAAGKAQYEPPVEMKVDTGQKDANGQPIVRVEYVPRTQIPQLAGGRQTTAADMANPNVVLSPEAYAGRVVTRESGGNYGAQSGTSTAGGGAQFTDGTWLSTVKATRPDLAQGKTDQQLLAMKSDTSPQGIALQNQMTVAYARQNAPVLAQAGMPVTSLTLGLAHQFGAQGAVNILSKPADTPITAQLVGADAMKENKQFRGKTVADVQAAAFRTYGVNPVNLGAGGAPSSVAPVTPGAVAGPPVLTPQQQAGLDVNVAAQKAGFEPPVEMKVSDGKGGFNTIYVPRNSQPTTPVAGPPVLTPQQTADLQVQTRGRESAFEPPVTFTVLSPDGKTSYEVTVPRQSLPALSGGVPSLNNLPPGAVVGAPKLSPQAAADLEVSKQRALMPVTLQAERGKQDIEQFTKYRTDLLEQSQSAQSQNALIDNMLAHSQTWQMGKFSDVKMDLFKTLDALGQPIGFKPNQSVGDWEAFNKDAVNLLRQAVHETKNVRAVQEWTILAKSLPQDETTPQGFTRIASEIQGVNDWKMMKSFASGHWQGNANEFEGQWNQNVSPMAFIVNRLSTPDTQMLAQNLNKTDQGRAIWRDIVQQTKMLHDRGLLRTATTPTGAAPG